MSWVNVQRQRWCEQDHANANVSVECSTSSDRQKTRSDVRRNSVDMSVARRPTCSWWLAAELRCCLDAASEFCYMLVISLRQVLTVVFYRDYCTDERTYFYATISQVIGRFFGIELLPDVARCVCIVKRRPFFSLNQCQEIVPPS